MITSIVCGKKKLVPTFTICFLLSCYLKIPKINNPDENINDSAPEVSCENIEEITSKIYYTFVIHNEEDDAEGVPGSSPQIPDYNGDEAVFNHFADAMYDYALMLSEHGAMLSFQPDWTFIEGVTNFRPDFFKDLLSTGNVEILPHAHETYKTIDEVYSMLEKTGAKPLKIIGGMTFDKYKEYQSWFETYPDYVFWDAPLATVGHVDDYPTPPLVYRMQMPENISEVDDCYIHDSNSRVIVTPGLPVKVPNFIELKPDGLYISPAYAFEATRFFLTTTDDTSLPEKWRKTNANQKTAAETITYYQNILVDELLPLKEQGKLEFKTVGEIINLYKKYEHCLDLFDGKDLTCELPDIAPPIDSEPTIGFIGCSLTLQAIEGYQKLGGQKFWVVSDNNFSNYPGGSGAEWYNDISDSRRRWNNFESILKDHSGTNKVWIEFCHHNENTTGIDDFPYESAKAIIDEVKIIAPGVQVYISHSAAFPDDDSIGEFCKGEEGPAYLHSLVNILVQNNLALQGPEISPITVSQLGSDGCHATKEGAAVWGQNLLDFFDSDKPPFFSVYD